MENQNSQLCAYERMRELHTWLDTWERYVQKKRTRDTETTDVNEPNPPRKRVVIKKSNLS